MSVLRLEFDLPKELDNVSDALKFFAKEAKYLVLIAEDGATKTVVLK